MVDDPALPRWRCGSRWTAAAAARWHRTRGRATLDREPLEAGPPWRPGQLIAVGGTLLGLAPYEPPDAALHPSEDGAGIDFNRPPRLLPPHRATKFQLPAPARPAASAARCQC